jgi:gliding motility-associated-like protein
VTFKIEVKPTPSIPDVTSNDTICQFTTSFSILDNVSGSNIKWYQNQFDLVDLGNVPLINTNIAQSNTFYVSQTVHNCESDKASVTLLVYPQPKKPSLDSNLNVCQNQQNITIKNHNNMGTIKWFTHQADSVYSLSQPIISTSNVGTQYFWASNEVNKCESKQLQIQINTLPNPDVTALVPGIICLGDTLKVKLSFTGVPDFTLVYENQGSQNTVNSNTEEKYLYLFPNNEDNIKFISVTDAFCATTYLNFVQAYIVNQLPNVSITAEDTICNNQNVTLNIQTNLPQANFTWSNDHNPIQTQAQTIVIDDSYLIQNINNLTKTPQKLVYTIKSYNGNCLGETVNKSIVVMPSYTASLPADDQFVCKDDFFAFELPKPIVGYQLQWFKDEVLLPNTSNVVNEKITQNTVLKLLVTDYCKNTDEQILLVNIHQKQALSDFMLIDSCLNFNSTLKANLPEYLNKSIWEINNGTPISKENTTQSTVVNQLFTSVGANVIHVTGYLNNCLLLDSTLVVDIVNCDIKVKNTFTPNDDGQNEFWLIEGIEKYPSASLEIFDRWGQKIKVFHHNVPYAAWDGKNNNGVTVESGTYYYIIAAPEFNINIRGHINVLW